MKIKFEKGVAELLYFSTPTTSPETEICHITGISDRETISLNLVRASIREIGKKHEGEHLFFLFAIDGRALLNGKEVFFCGSGTMMCIPQGTIPSATWEIETL